jgi:hypothetical protein
MLGILTEMDLQVVMTTRIPVIHKKHGAKKYWNHKEHLTME